MLSLVKVLSSAAHQMGPKWSKIMVGEETWPNWYHYFKTALHNHHLSFGSITAIYPNNLGFWKIWISHSLASWDRRLYLTRIAKKTGFAIITKNPWGNSVCNVGPRVRQNILFQLTAHKEFPQLNKISNKKLLIRSEPWCVWERYYFWQYIFTIEQR